MSFYFRKKKGKRKKSRSAGKLRDLDMEEIWHVIMSRFLVLPRTFFVAQGKKISNWMNNNLEKAPDKTRKDMKRDQQNNPWLTSPKV